MPLLRPIAATLITVALAAPVVRAQVATEVPRTHTPRPTSAEITVEDVRTREYIIADDSMEGRDTGRRGGLRSAQYIAGELKRLGLEPAGDNGTYLQRIPWVSRTPDTTGVLRAGTQTLRWGTDYLVLPKLGFALALGGQPFGGGFRGDGVATVYGGKIGDSTIAPDLTRGKVVVFAAPAIPVLATRQSASLCRRTCDRRRDAGPWSAVGVSDAGVKRTGIRPPRAASCRSP